MHIGIGQVVGKLAGHGVSFADLLALQTGAIQHIVEVHVAADVKLAGVQQLDAAIVEQVGQHTVDNRRPDLALDVIADHGQPALREALLPVFLAGDEHRDAVDKRAAGVEDLLDIPLGGLLAAHRQEVDHDIGPGVPENLGDVGGGAGGLGDLLGQIGAQPVMSHAPVHGHADPLWHIGEADCVVLAGPDGFTKVFADLFHVNVERR